MTLRPRSVVHSRLYVWWISKLCRNFDRRRFVSSCITQQPQLLFTTCKTIVLVYSYEATVTTGGRRRVTTQNHRRVTDCQEYIITTEFNGSRLCPCSSSCVVCSRVWAGLTSFSVVLQVTYVLHMAYWGKFALMHYSEQHSLNVFVIELLDAPLVAGLPGQLQTLQTCAKQVPLAV